MHSASRLASPASVSSPPPSLSLPHSLSPFKQQDSRGVTLRTAPALFLANEGRVGREGKGKGATDRAELQSSRFVSGPRLGEIPGLHCGLSLQACTHPRLGVRSVAVGLARTGKSLPLSIAFRGRKLGSICKQGMLRRAALRWGMGEGRTRTWRVSGETERRTSEN